MPKSKQAAHPPVIVGAEKLKRFQGIRKLPQKMRESKVYRKLAPQTRRARILYIVVLLVLLAGAGASIWYTWQNRSADNQSITPTQQEPDPLTLAYNDLEDDQVKDKLLVETDLKLESLQKKEITSSSFTNYAQAFKAARALYAVEEYEKSAAAFEVAEQKMTKKDFVTYEFYVEYARVLDDVEQYGKATEYIKKAIAALKKDTTLDKDVRNNHIETLEKKLKIREIEGM